MRSTEECVRIALDRAAAARARRDRLVGYVTVGLCAALGVLVVAPLGLAGGRPSAFSSQGLSGASLFGDGVGGYVLVGLVSCVVAVAVTLALVRRRGRTVPSADVPPAEVPRSSAGDETYRHIANDQEM